MCTWFILPEPMCSISFKILDTPELAPASPPELALI
jgi:hypothetical protein